MFTRETMSIAPGWESLLRANDLATLAGVYKLAGGEIVTRTRTTEVRRIELRDGLAVRTLFIKQYWANRFGQLWSGALRGTFLGRSKARREFENLARLREWGLDAPAPVAFGEDRRCRWLTRSFLISEGVMEPQPLDVFIRDVLPMLPAPEQQRTHRELIERLADYVRRLHARRFVHHDLFWRNIILNGQRLDHFHLIDAHKGGVWPPWAGLRPRAKDLATLDAAAPAFFRRSERLRFLLRYLGCQLNPQGRQLLALSLRLTSPLRERQLRRVGAGPRGER
jgi:tRNA A-37 threonylcarbamoyl transferase component Bud32